MLPTVARLNSYGGNILNILKFQLKFPDFLYNYLTNIIKVEIVQRSVLELKDFESISIAKFPSANNKSITERLETNSLPNICE